MLPGRLSRAATTIVARQSHTTESATGAGAERARAEINVPMGNGIQPVVPADDDQFAVSGVVLDMAATGTVDGCLAVTCSG
jgi:hypothetical protein